MVQKNDPGSGGSLYIQAKLVTAKECLLEKIQDANHIEREYVK